MNLTEQQKKNLKWFVGILAVPTLCILVGKIVYSILFVFWAVVFSSNVVAAETVTFLNLLFMFLVVFFLTLFRTLEDRFPWEQEKK